MAILKLNNKLYLLAEVDQRSHEMVQYVVDRGSVCSMDHSGLLWTVRTPPNSVRLLPMREAYLATMESEVFGRILPIHEVRELVKGSDPYDIYRPRVEDRPQVDGKALYSIYSRILEAKLKKIKDERLAEDKEK